MKQSEFTLKLILSFASGRDHYTWGDIAIKEAERIAKLMSERGYFDDAPDKRDETIANLETNYATDTASLSSVLDEWKAKAERLGAEVARLRKVLELVEAQGSKGDVPFSIMDEVTEVLKEPSGLGLVPVDWVPGKGLVYREKDPSR